MAERQGGRLVNLSQVLPELLQHLSSGYRAANARYTDSRTGKRRQLSMVPLRSGSRMCDGLRLLLPLAISVLEQNDGVPLAARRLFPSARDAGVLLSTSDASGDDGCGGYAFSRDHTARVVIVSEPWPEDVRAALAQAALPPDRRTPGAAMLSMPAAELWSAWAVAAAAAGHFSFEAVIAVGDCGPAVNALNAAASGTPQMAAVLHAARQSVQQWLGVHVPREWNVDADRLSHPTLLSQVLADAAAAGLAPIVAAIPAHCWAALRAALTIRAEL